MYRDHPTVAKPCGQPRTQQLGYLQAVFNAVFDADSVDEAELMKSQRVLVTGATGMVGRRLVPRLLEAGYQVAALVRDPASASDLQAAGAELSVGDLASPESVVPALNEADIVVHTAAHVGDWGPPEQYRAINVDALEKLVTAAQRIGRLQRWIQISSLGVYGSRDHYGTDESASIVVQGIDGYTQTKAEAEVILRRYVEEWQFPAVVLRPGFIYGPGDRHVLPRLIEKLHDGSLKLIGKGDRLLNNIYVDNLNDAILLAMEKDEAIGEVFNLRDRRLVTRREFIGAICEYFDRPLPPSVPLALAKVVVGPMESMARLRGAKTAPLLTRARMKFMTKNLDFSIEKAERVLGYRPAVDFREGMLEALRDAAPASQSSSS